MRLPAKSLARLALFVALLAALLPPLFDLTTGGRAQETGKYFPETQHSVESPFYDFFSDNGGVAIFGYPITEQHEDPATGLRVQYFQRARMEYAGRNPLATVTLGNLAEEMGYGKPALRAGLVEADTPFRRFFPVTGHSTSYAFLAYFNDHGGADVFGYPISEPFVENGRLVQYFQRARLEWWPERAPSERVQLTQLGVIYAEQRVPAAWLEPALTSARPGPSGSPREAPEVTTLRISASVKDPIARQAGFQTIFVQVSDQSGAPLPDASVQLVVNAGSGPQIFSGPATSEYGIAAITFPLQPEKPGKTVVVEVTVRYGAAGVTARSQTSYLVWWGAQ
jgi:hypothetical protein